MQIFMEAFFQMFLFVLAGLHKLQFLLLMDWDIREIQSLHVASVWWLCASVFLLKLI